MTKKDVGKRATDDLRQRSLPTGTVTMPLHGDDSTQALISEPESTTAENYLENYTAPISVPRREAITVKLGPVNLVERLKEYQSDENLLIFFLGIFLGAILGIVSNWATDREFIVTPYSIVLLFFLALLSLGVFIWLWRIRVRKNKANAEIDDLYKE